jgi:hypothetical protein
VLFGHDAVQDGEQPIKPMLGECDGGFYRVDQPPEHLFGG